MTLVPLVEEVRARSLPSLHADEVDDSASVPFENSVATCRLLGSIAALKDGTKGMTQYVMRILAAFLIIMPGVALGHC